MRLLFRYWVVWGNMKGAKVMEVENTIGRQVQGYMMDLLLDV